jgi:hypothetical protein
VEDLNNQLTKFSKEMGGNSPKVLKLYRWQFEQMKFWYAGHASLVPSNAEPEDVMVFGMRLVIVEDWEEAMELTKKYKKNIIN